MFHHLSNFNEATQTEELHQTSIWKIKHTLQIVYHNLFSDADPILTEDFSQTRIKRIKSCKEITPPGKDSIMGQT